MYWCPPLQFLQFYNAFHYLLNNRVLSTYQIRGNLDTFPKNNGNIFLILSGPTFLPVGFPHFSTFCFHISASLGLRNVDRSRFRWLPTTSQSITYCFPPKHQHTTASLQTSLTATNHYNAPPKAHFHHACRVQGRAAIAGTYYRSY